MQLIAVLSLLIGGEIKKARGKRAESTYKIQVSCDPIAKFDVGLFHVGQI